jgi:VWFA-related protein
METFHIHFFHGPDQRGVLTDLYGPLSLLHDRETPCLLFFRNVIGHLKRGSVWPRRIFEAEYGIVLNLVKQAKRLFEILFRLAREADDDVGRNRDGSPRILDPPHLFHVLVARIEAQHGFEHAGRSRLHRQMHVIAQIRVGIDRIHDGFHEIARMRSGEANAPDAADRAHAIEQRGEIPSGGGGIAVAVDVLPQQLYFGVAGIGEAFRFFHYAGAGAAALRPAGERDDAIGATLIASLNDRYISAMRIVTAREWRIEGLVGVEAQAGHALVARLELHQHLGQFRIARRTRHQTDVRRAVENFLAFLLGNAADYGEDFPLPRVALEVLQAIKNLLFGFIAYAAGVVENVVRRFHGFHLGVALVEQRAHDLFRVVRIHLAPKSLDVEGFIHFSYCSPRTYNDRCMNAERIMLRSIGALFLAVELAAAQQVPPPPTFRTSTELVQVSVIVQDKQGNPVADLRREEFQIFDNGVPQEIRLFVPETETSNPAPPEPKAANTFTNQIAAPGGPHSGYSVILIDDLFSGSDPTNEEGSSLSRVRALKTLRSIPVGETIAIYAPGRTLRIICEFTSDRDLLERQLRKWKPYPTTPAPEVRPSLQTLLNPQLAQTHGDAEIARIDEVQRASAGDFEMELIADHVAGIPGRKNLIWLANKFPIGPRALQKLTRAGVSIYPVDIDGVCRLCPERPTQSMDFIAAITGGIAYYHRNDVDIAIREAMDDDRVSYTVGFYPSGDNDRASEVHRLMMKVSRPGVELRYGTSYQPRAAPPAPVTTADLVHALNRPIDATAIPVRASVTRTQDRLNLEAVFGVEGLDLVQVQNLWTGKIEVVARFTTADGVVASDAFAQTLILNLNQTSWDAAMHSGLAYHNELKIPARAVELKLLFANPPSGKIGTLTIPLSKVTYE